MDPAVETCGCAAPTRWRCDRCGAREVDFFACSRECLGAHFARTHAGVEVGSYLDRVRSELQAHNRANDRNWQDFEPHRLTLSRLVGHLAGEGGICVLGAGNCDDLDLGLLASEFGEVHLVDLDGAALRRGVARSAAAESGTIVVHEGIDLTGLLGSLESWGDDPSALEQAMSGAAEAIAQTVGRTFRVVLSSGVMSQLCVPFYRVLARRPAEWEEFMRGVGHIHLRTIALLTRPGGSGVLVGDALYSTRAAPAPVPTWDSLPPDFEERLRNGSVLLRNPQSLLTLLHEPHSTSLLEYPEITQPWLWTVEDAVMLAYAILFRRKASAFDPVLTEIHTRSNRQTEEYWDLYEEHRERLTSLVKARAPSGHRGSTLCVLGAGNCNGLDLDALLGCFERIHLVDLDSGALERAVERCPPATRRRLVMHAPVDLSGVLPALPRWRGEPPEPLELASLFGAAPRTIAATLPGPFDVVVSDCILSQIYWTCFQALGNGGALRDVLATALAIHLRSLAALTFPCGTALLITDAVTSETVPLGELFERYDPLELLHGLDRQGLLFSGTSPAFIARELAGETLAGDFGPPEIIAPWLWRMGRSRSALVYALALAKKP